MFKTMMWATDGSEGADMALAAALELSKLQDARIVAVHVNQRLSGRAGGWPALPDEDELLLKIRRQVEALKKDGVDIDIVVRRASGAPAHVIAGLAGELGADMIVCGTHGERAFAGALLGSVAHGLLHEAACPVLVVPQRAHVLPQTMPEEAVTA